MAVASERVLRCEGEHLSVSCHVRVPLPPTSQTLEGAVLRAFRRLGVMVK